MSIKDTEKRITLLTNVIEDLSELSYTAGDQDFTMYIDMISELSHTRAKEEEHLELLLDLTEQDESDE